MVPKAGSFSPGVDQADVLHARVAECRIRLLSGLGMATGPVLAIAGMFYCSSSHRPRSKAGQRCYAGWRDGQDSANPMVSLAIN